MLVLGIESSCDETSAAVVSDGRHVLSNVILSQMEHTRFGGVVPEVASREHLKTIVGVYREALERASVPLKEVGLVAATMGPGLVGPLLVGLTFAKGLAFAAGIPFVAVNHMEGHLAANILQHSDLDEHHLTLVVSGGHTMLVEVLSFGKYVMIGQTRDDAAGEAFDKVAKIMGLGYPGGARIDKLAASGNPSAFRFPRPMLKDGTSRFSFSGLKTAVSLELDRMPPDERESRRADVAASFQQAAVEVLVDKTIGAARQRQLRDVTISGGVAANSGLRHLMAKRCREHGLRLFYPDLQLCTDNAAMIAAAGFYRFKLEGASDFTANAVPYLKLV